MSINKKLLIVFVGLLFMGIGVFIGINHSGKYKAQVMAKAENTVIFDGIISQRLVDVASLKGIKRLVAFRSMNIVKKPDNLKIITMD